MLPKSLLLMVLTLVLALSFVDAVSFIRVPKRTSFCNTFGGCSSARSLRQTTGKPQPPPEDDDDYDIFPDEVLPDEESETTPMPTPKPDEDGDEDDCDKSHRIPSRGMSGRANRKINYKPIMRDYGERRDRRGYRRNDPKDWNNSNRFIFEEEEWLRNQRG